tara:strand:- start:18671 stop:19327 length:657 start_codon:yes stop_codon:yes gene_type:complete
VTEISESLKVFKNIDQLNLYVVDEIISASNTDRESAIILSGGKTPAPIYQTLNSSSDINKKARFVLSDERRVPITDPLSNEGMVRSYLKNINENNILSLHDLSISDELESIDQYQLAIIGLGLDGHTASIFPLMHNREEALSTTKPILRVDSGFPDVPRITLSLNEILKSKKIILLAPNKDKITLLQSKRTQPNLLPIDYLIQQVASFEILTLKFNDI